MLVVVVVVVVGAWTLCWGFVGDHMVSSQVSEMLSVCVGGWLRGRSVECNRKVENLGCSREAVICLSVGSAFGVVQVGCWCAWTLVCMYVGVLLRPYGLQSSE